jgi:hypothetical protein
VCSEIDFKRYLKPTIGKDAYNSESSPKRASKRLGKVRDILQKENCEFCRLVAKVIPLNVSHFEIPDLADMEVVLCAQYVTFLQDLLGHEKEISQIRLEFLHPTGGWPVELPLHHTLQLESSARSNREGLGSSESLEGRPIRRDGVDIENLNHWLNECESTHGSTCEATSWVSSVEQPASLCVLDVNSLQVVNAPQNCKYAALSYVWGSTEMPESGASKDGIVIRDYSSVFQDLPLTIQDAIILMRRLGQRYIWVDAMCIDQHENADKMEQIGHMDQIYGLADFTIVAAAGDNADAGLPGVRPGSRLVRQESGTIQDMRLITALPAKIPVDWSKWNDRGWTFQERLLSRRCIIFTDHQVYFQCKKRNWSEDTHIDDSRKVKMNVRQIYRRFESMGSPAALNFYQAIDSGVGDLKPRDLQATKYEALVTQYTKRKFTYDTDALHAFRGVEKLLARSIPGQFHNGLPDILLDEALLWQPVLDSNPNFIPRPFPSYSWASWNGPVHYNHQPGVRSVNHFFEEKEDESCRVLDTSWIKKGGHAGFGSDAEDLRGITERAVSMFNEKLATERLTSPKLISQNAPKEEANILIFYAKFALLYLKPFGWPKGLKDSGWVICQVLHEGRELTTTPGRGAVERDVPVTIALDTSWVRKNIDHPCEFILVALECRSFTQHAHIMLVEKHQDGYRRVGLTKIEWSQWSEVAERQMKLIALV